MKVFHRNYKNKGFSLIEVVIAMSVMAFALIAIYSVFIRGASDIDYGKKKTIATTAAQEKLEQLRSLHFDDPLLTAGADTVTINNFTVDRIWTVTNMGPQLKEIKVDVIWKGRSSNQTYTITTKKRKIR